ncbi:MAG: hypothetical protein SGI90_05155 [Candidatus Eisenbacteria bacterium]|nr:hypothetical protein [Candidatus Eisenbacteria bacterium]
MNKKTLLWVGLVAAGALVFFALKGYPPAGNGTEGTIGAAKRYQAEQIKSSDVQLGDTSMNDVLQSELFHKMMTNEDFRKLVTSDGFRSAAAEDGFGRMVNDAGARGVLNDGDVQRAAAPEGDLGKLLASDASLLVTTADGQRLIAADGFGKFMADASARQTVEDALSRRFADASKWATTDAGKRQIEAARAAAIDGSRMTAEAGKVSADASKQSAELGKVSADASKRLADAGKVSMDANKMAAEAEARVMEAARRQTLDASKLSADADVARLVKKYPELGKMMESDSFKNLASTGKLSTVLADDGLARAAASEDVAKILARPEAARVLAEYGRYLPDLGKTGRVAELGRVMTDASFVQAFSDPGFGKSLAAVDGAKLHAMADQMARNAHQ